MAWEVDGQEVTERRRPARGRRAVCVQVGVAQAGLFSLPQVEVV